MATKKRQKSKNLKALRALGVSFPLAALVARYMVLCDRPALLRRLEAHEVPYQVRLYDFCGRFEPEDVVVTDPKTGTSFRLNYFTLALLD